MDINLLPWRQEMRVRKTKKMAWYWLLGLTVAVSVLLCFDEYTQTCVHHQEKRNQRLQREIVFCKKAINDVQRLKIACDTLRHKINTMRQLKTTQTLPVRFLYELMRLIPNGVWLNQIERHNDDVMLIGYAKSPNRVTTVMHHLAHNLLIRETGLPEIKTIHLKHSSIQHEFKVHFFLKDTLSIVHKEDSLLKTIL